MRLRALIIAAVCGLFGAAGSGCSMVLGLEDPTTGDDGGDDTGDDPEPRVLLAFNVDAVSIAQLQGARLRVSLVRPDATMQDVTTDATYTSDNPGVASVTVPGRIDGGSPGTATITASMSGARAGAVTVTVAPKLCQPVINEFQTEGASASDEWVEILNPCTTAITVNGWTLVYRGDKTIGQLDSNLLVTLSGQLQPGEVKLFGGTSYVGTKDGTLASGLGGSSGALGLRAGAVSAGMLVDALAYGGAVVAMGHPFLDGSDPLPAMAASQSAARQPFDGHDENKATDFMLGAATTPRAPNAP